MRIDGPAGQPLTEENKGTAPAGPSVHVHLRPRQWESLEDLRKEWNEWTVEQDVGGFVRVARHSARLLIYTNQRPQTNLVLLAVRVAVGAGRRTVLHRLLCWSCGWVVLAMDITAEMPLQIDNLKSARSDESIVALGIEGSANKVKMTKTYKHYVRKCKECLDIYIHTKMVLYFRTLWYATYD